MKVFILIADCITRNSSANLCHLAYINGLLELGCNVDLLSGDGREYITDKFLSIPNTVNSHLIYGVSKYEKLSLKYHHTSSSTLHYHNHQEETISSIKTKVIKKTKKLISRYLYGPHGAYISFVRKAKKFSIFTRFDYIISISSPSASHLLAYKLLEAKKITATKWIQIWEDPWSSDIYGNCSDKRTANEERKLLKKADSIYYVSPLTLKNQKRLFPESAYKMYWQPLPYYYKNDTVTTVAEKKLYGYFGDYAPVSRDLKPFYEAAKQSSIQVNICGSPNNLFASTDSITIYPRLPLDKLKPIEDKTNVLIFLCNRKGGQIPGKIYQYSATYKTILFILDGTDEEKKVLREYFEKFNRYVFCENTVEDITRTIKDIESGNIGSVKNEPVEAFNPKETIRKILAGEMG